MKTESLAVRLSTGVVLALLSCTVNNGRAASTTLIPNASDGYAQAAPFLNIKWEEAKIEKLRHAYYLMDHAKQDYHGHRVEAIRHLKKAGEALGVEIKGGGPHPEEHQWDSDRNLTEAKHILEGLVDETHGTEQEHLHNAVKELEKALAVK